jgi:hypothetical protein
MPLSASCCSVDRSADNYRKQIGHIRDARIALLAHFHPQTALTSEQAAAILHSRKC